jgi:hypothetical protein
MSIAGGNFGSQAQFLRTILGLPSLLPTSASLDSLSFIHSQVFAIEKKVYQYGPHEKVGHDNNPVRYLYLLRQDVIPSVDNHSAASQVPSPPSFAQNVNKDQTTGFFDGALSLFYNWKLNLRNSHKTNDARNWPVQKNEVEKNSRFQLFYPTPYFSSSRRNRGPLEIDRERLNSNLRENIVRFHSVSVGNDRDRSFGARFSLALIIQDFIAEIKKIDSEVKEIHDWATAKESGLVHWMDYFSLTWNQKVKGVDIEDLRLVIERLSYDLELYSEIQVLWGRYSRTFDDTQILQVQLNRSIERTREMRFLLAAVFYRLIVGISDDPKDKKEFHDIRMRMIQIGLDFPH